MSILDAAKKGKDGFGGLARVQGAQFETEMKRMLKRNTIELRRFGGFFYWFRTRYTVYE